jgi:hypothetical protein
MPAQSLFSASPTRETSGGERMKIGTIVFMALVAALAVMAPSATQANQAGQLPGATMGIPGYLDPRTGEFHAVPVRPAAVMGGIMPNAVITGKLVYNYTITIKSTLPTGDVIACNTSNDVFDTTSGKEFDEMATVAAVRSGSTATCTVDVPYSWTLTGTSDTVSATEMVTVPSDSTSLPGRVSSQTLTAIKVPATGTTTTTAVTFTI